MATEKEKPVTESVEPVESKEKDTSESKKVADSSKTEDEVIDNLVVNTPYDNAFRTMVNDCSKLLFAVINEAFGKNYHGDEQIIFHPNEHFINKQDGKESKRITDSAFTIIGIDERNNRTEDNYVIECQSSADNSMLVRVFEYITQVALDQGKLVDNKLIVSIPNATVIFLRSKPTTADEMEIEMRTPGGVTHFIVPVMKIRNYTIDMIFDRKLYFLIPFYIFNHEERFEEYNTDNTKLEELISDCMSLMSGLDSLAKDGVISVYYAKTIKEMAKMVTDNIAVKFENIRKGVDPIMGGKVLEHESKTIFNEGRAEGREEGLVEGKKEAALGMAGIGLKVEDIATALKVSVDIVKQWIGTGSSEHTAG